MSTGSMLLLAFLMLALSFFFSGVEIAFLSASLLKIELKTKQGNQPASILSQFKKPEKRSKVLVSILVGNNIALVIFTLMVEGLLSLPLSQWGIDPQNNFLLSTLIISLVGTLIVLVFAEYIPKAVFKSTADKVIFPSAYILSFFYHLLFIPVWLIDVISRVILKYFFGIKKLEESTELGKQDLDYYIKEVISTGTGETGPVQDVDTEMLNAALEFRETKAREFMIPRTQIEAAEIETSIDELMAQFIETQLSKIIIYGESLDDIKGFVHCNSMFENPESVAQAVQEVLIIPETMPADMLLEEFNENKKTVALVVDEFGGTAGLITMEDLLEEIFGEIEDEYDVEDTEEDMLIRKNNDMSFLLGARLEIDDINETLGLSLPDEEYYSTLGGLFMYYAEDIPKPKEEIAVGEYKLTAEKVTQNRIIQITLDKG